MRAPGEKEFAIDGRFVEGNAKEGIPPSILTAAWLQDFWASHKTLITRGGRTLGADGTNDLYLAIQAMIAASISADDIDLSDYLTIARAAELYGYHIIHLSYDQNNPSDNNIFLSAHKDFLNRTLWLTDRNDNPREIVINLNEVSPIGTRFQVAAVSATATIQAASPAVLFGTTDDFRIEVGDVVEIFSLGSDGWRMHKRLPLFKDYEHPQAGFGYSRTTRKVWRNVSATAGKLRVLAHYRHEPPFGSQLAVKFESSIKESGSSNFLYMHVALNQSDQPDLVALGNLMFAEPSVWLIQGAAQELRQNLHTLHEYQTTANAPVYSFVLTSSENVEADWVSIEIQETT